jgi:hypothetical protein
MVVKWPTLKVVAFLMDESIVMAIPVLEFSREGYKRFLAKNQL